jgi:hypothetical protein
VKRAVEAMTLSLALTAVAAAENIDPANNNSQLAWAENVGWLNAEPSGNGGPGIQVNDFNLTGWMWGENIGWISLSCQDTSSCGAITYGVAHDSFGVLSGFAWAENAGWINFAPSTAGVTFDPGTGDFAGYAWGENVGWVGFNCTNTASCATGAYKVTTGWTCTAAAPAGIPLLTLAKSGGDAVISWQATGAAGRHDVVRGSLGILKGSNQSGTSLSFGGTPTEGAGFWLLVRAVNCGGNGTYDSGGTTQIGVRDAEIAASTNHCP